jgi:chromosome segregation ATPase
MAKQLLDELQAKYDQLREETKSTSEAMVNLQSKYDALSEERDDMEGVHNHELEATRSQRDAYAKQLSELERSHGDVVAQQLTVQESQAKLLETQQTEIETEIEQKYASLLDALQNDTARLEQEKSTALAGKQSALNELVALKEQLNAEIEGLKAGQTTKEEPRSSESADLAAKYEALLAEKATSDKEHEDAVALLKSSLKEDHDQSFSNLQSQYDTLQHQLAVANQEHGDALELLKEEFKAGHSNDMRALQQQIETLQKQHADLTEQKAAMDQAHEEAISELMAGMEASTSDAVQELQKKYDTLADELEAARSNHVTELEATKQDTAEPQTTSRDLISPEDTAINGADTPPQDAKRFEEFVREVERERDEAIKAAEQAENRLEAMKEEVVRKHVARVGPLEKENALLNDKIDRLQAIIKAGDRIARAAATMGEKRNINTLSEEDEDEDDDATLNDALSSQINGAPKKDVVGTVS